MWYLYTAMETIINDLDKDIELIVDQVSIKSKQLRSMDLKEIIENTPNEIVDCNERITSDGFHSVFFLLIKSI
jgi:hypothetical protein